MYKGSASFNNQGQIINIGSLAAKLAAPKTAGYSASKHAITGFTYSLGIDLLGKNIFVSLVNPGPIETNFFDVADESGNYFTSAKNKCFNLMMLRVKLYN